MRRSPIVLLLAAASVAAQTQRFTVVEASIPDMQRAMSEGRIIVPFARVPNSPPEKFPDGFDARPSPSGVSFSAGACSEPRLLALAYAFEQATRRRVPPPDLP